MKVLHTVELYPPSQGGMQEVVKQLSERLAARGHDVTVATTRLPERTGRAMNGITLEEFAISGNAVRGFEGELERYQQYLRDSRFDIITNFAAQQWATDLALPLLPEITAKKVFVPTGFSGLYRPEYAGYFDSMKTWMGQYDANVFLSDDYRDINFARENGIGNRVLIPNGAAADEFSAEPGFDIRRRLRVPKDHFLILLVGSHTNFKGHREAIEIFQAANLRNATLLICANKIGPGCRRDCFTRAALFAVQPEHWREHKRLIVTTLSRAETVAAYHAADLFLFPSNIECSPLVLFECMASRTPFLTTDVGNAAEIIAWSAGGRLLPTSKDADSLSHADIPASARLLEEMSADPAQRERMANAGHAAWEARFTWEQIAADYESLYSDLLEK